MASALPRRLVRPVGLLALRRRQTGVIRRLARPCQIVDPRLQLGNELQGRIQARRQRQDQRIFLRVGEFAEVEVVAHPSFRIESAVTVSSKIRRSSFEAGMSSYGEFIE